MRNNRRFAQRWKQVTLLITLVAVLSFFSAATHLEAVTRPGGGSAPIPYTIKTPLDKPLEYPVNINTTDAKTLMRVPGINKTAARQIVNHRKRNGNYTSLDQIKEFSGIGNAGISRLRKYLTVK